jgi:choice-of-anchor C domain-containing protein
MGKNGTKTRTRVTLASFLTFAVTLLVVAGYARDSHAQVPTTPSTMVRNLVFNGSFERPVATPPCAHGTTGPGFCTYLAGSAGVPNWTIGGNSIDLVTSQLWMPATGQQSVDLSGDLPGSIRQSVSTTAGSFYDLTWEMAGNPACGQKLKVMNVSWDGVLMATQKFDTTKHSFSAMGWVRKTIRVEAIGPESTIGFADATPDKSRCGATLDAVRLTAST